jgi:peptidoglycan L-alanyl-D-glutamate endopeptidase CwlK
VSDKAASPRFDERTEANLRTLLPPVAERARKFLALANEALAAEGLTVKVISGTRTYAEQDALYAIGRGEGDKRARVTNARAGQSNHNFGVAFDIGLFRGKVYLTESEWYAKLGPIGEKAGFNWGGRWKSLRDTPHYEYPTGLTLAQMRARVAKGQSVLPEKAEGEAKPTPRKWSVFVGDRLVAVDVTETGVVRAVAEALGASVGVVNEEKRIVLTAQGAKGF